MLTPHSHPDKVALADTFGQYAHNHVTGTRVSYAYNQAAGTVNATYSVTTTAREGSGSGTVIALYPHQWRYLTGATPLAWAIRHDLPDLIALLRERGGTD